MESHKMFKLRKAIV